MRARQDGRGNYIQLPRVAPPTRYDVDLENAYVVHKAPKVPDLNSHRSTPVNGSDWASDASERGDDEEDDDDVASAKFTCTWRLHLVESVYDDALITPLAHPIAKGKKSFCVFLASTYLTLFVNGALQLLILIKFSQLNENQKAQTAHKLYGLCRKRTQSELGFTQRLNETPDDGVYYDCGPLAATAMTDVNRLDLNNDGIWSYDEAVQLDSKLKTLSAKPSSLLEAYNRFFASAQRGEFSSRNVLANSTSVGLSPSAPGIPLDMMRVAEKDIQLCMTTDANLCGNLEARDILMSHFPDLPSPHERIVSCKSHIHNKCLDWYGELFQCYNDWSFELCGTSSSIWVESKNLIATEYSLATKYSSRGNGAILSVIYEAFLLVVLVIWWTSMVDEMRQIVTWWVVLMFIPTKSASGKPSLEIEEDSACVTWIPYWHKVSSLLINILPRTIVCVWLSIVGSFFLIRADDYGDLILNSVALGFLIQIDNMLFGAVVGDDSKDLLVPYTIFIMGVSLGLITYSYTHPGGKNDTGLALSCLCHAEGSTCVSAQILGGYPSLAAVGVH